MKRFTFRHCSRLFFGLFCVVPRKTSISSAFLSVGTRLREVDGRRATSVRERAAGIDGQSLTCVLRVYVLRACGARLAPDREDGGPAGRAQSVPGCCDDCARVPGRVSERAVRRAALLRSGGGNAAADEAPRRPGRRRRRRRLARKSERRDPRPDAHYLQQ